MRLSPRNSTKRSTSGKIQNSMKIKMKRISVVGKSSEEEHQTFILGQLITSNLIVFSSLKVKKRSTSNDAKVVFSKILMRLTQSGK